MNKIRSVESGGSEIRIGISSCLLGKKVRFDGGHKHDRYATDLLGQFVTFVPICPEIEIGMGVPREAVVVFSKNLDSDAPHLLSLFFRANTRIVGDI
jgi:uncharacterized protein YbbK (DUF523 family)